MTSAELNMRKGEVETQQQRRRIESYDESVVVELKIKRGEGL